MCRGYGGGFGLKKEVATLGKVQLLKYPGSVVHEDKGLSEAVCKTCTLPTHICRYLDTCIHLIHICR